MKKCITGLLLLAFAVPSWAEDEVWYCVEEHRHTLEDKEREGVYKLVRYIEEKFTLKYEAEENRIAIMGRTWGGDEPYYLKCNTCLPNSNHIDATDGLGGVVRFSMLNDRFFSTSTSYVRATMTTGTCTKF